MIGCASIRTREDSFASLHRLVKQTLADSADCGPIITNEIVGGRYFEVTPQPSGLRITVFERQFFTQKEWERRYASGWNLISEFIEMTMTNHPTATNHSIDAKAAEQFSGATNLFGVFDLPGWSYQSTGVDVSVQEVDEVYPGLQEDVAEAQKRYKEIVKLLKRYHRAKQGAAGNPDKRHQAFDL